MRDNNIDVTKCFDSDKNGDITFRNKVKAPADLSTAM